jgi:hypothetical protein
MTPRITPRTTDTPVTHSTLAGGHAGEFAGDRSERPFTELPASSGTPAEDDAVVALFAAAGIAVEVVTTCGDASCPECFTTRSGIGSGDRLAA